MSSSTSMVCGAVRPTHHTTAAAAAAASGSAGDAVTLRATQRRAAPSMAFNLANMRGWAAACRRAAGRDRINSRVEPTCDNTQLAFLWPLLIYPCDDRLLWSTADQWLRWSLVSYHWPVVQVVISFLSLTSSCGHLPSTSGSGGHWLLTSGSGGHLSPTTD